MSAGETTLLVTPPEVLQNDTLEVTIVQELNGQAILNVLHYKVNEASNNPSIEEVADGFYTAWVATEKLLNRLWALQSQDLKYLGLRVQTVSPERKAYWFKKAVDSDGPSNGADALPVNVTAVITKRASKVGRKYHGDVFIAGLGVDAIEKSLWLDTTYTELEQLADTLKEDVIFSGIDANPIIYHGDTAEATNDDFVMAAVPHRESRVMRRRTVGLGV
jgi:hypothetical protein